MLEYAPNKFVVHILPANILVVHQNTIVATIAEPNPSNNEKNLLMLIPDFHEDKLPFIVSTGNETLNLVNISTGRTQVLV